LRRSRRRAGPAGEARALRERFRDRRIDLNPEPIEEPFAMPHLSRLAISAVLWLGASNTAALAEPPAPAKAVAPVAADRADLGRAYLRLETQVARVPPSEAQRRDANRRFDGLTMLFFAGRFGPAIRQVAELEADLRGLEGAERDDFLRLLECRWSIEPAIATLGGLPPLRVIATALSGAGAGGGDGQVPDAAIAAVLRGPAGETRSARLRAGETLALDLDAAPLRPGRWRLFAEVAVGDPVELAVVDLVETSPATRVAAFRERLDAIDAGGLAQLGDLDLLRSRVALLAGEGGATAALVIDPHTLAAQIDEELAAVEAGGRAHAAVVGDRWRTVSLGASRMPMRLYIPASVRDSGAAAPLIVVLHGAGGDEHMFMDGYGAGLIRDLAERRGFVVASPSTTLFATGGFLEPMLEEIAAIVPIDPARIHLLGHSMGAAAAARVGTLFSDRIAAMALVAGNAALDARRDPPPALVIAGEFDPLAAPARLRGAVAAAREAGLDVSFEVAEGSGHTLVVGETLPMAVEWLLERRLR
jgi:predicted esterase